MESDYQSLFQVRLANYDDIPAIMNITREAFVKYQQMSGVGKSLRHLKNRIMM